MYVNYPPGRNRLAIKCQSFLKNKQTLRIEELEGRVFPGNVNTPYKIDQYVSYMLSTTYIMVQYCTAVFCKHIQKSAFPLVF